MGWSGRWIKIGSRASQKHGFASQIWRYFERGTQKIARGSLGLVESHECLWKSDSSQKVWGGGVVLARVDETMKSHIEISPGPLCQSESEANSGWTRKPARGSHSVVEFNQPAFPNDPLLSEIGTWVLALMQHFLWVFMYIFLGREPIAFHQIFKKKKKSVNPSMRTHYSN